jgi:hypothetical protein
MNRCARCAADPMAHCFIKFGKTIGGESLFYTNPARARDYKESAQKLADFKVHLAEARGRPWIWIFDCAGVEYRHYSSVEFVQEIGRVFMAEHADTLRAIIVVHPTLILRAAVAACRPFFQKDLMAKLRIIDADGLELMVKLGELGIPTHWLFQTFRVPIDQPIQV